jgi:hypothetical protein
MKATVQGTEAAEVIGRRCDLRTTNSEVAASAATVTLAKFVAPKMKETGNREFPLR